MPSPRATTLLPCFVDDSALRERVREHLGATPDLERALARD